MSEQAKSKMHLTQDAALVKFVDLDLTREKYRKLRFGIEEVFPPYKDVLAAKKRCYPTNIEITESSARISLQSMVDHSVQRLLQAHGALLEQIDVNKRNALQIIFKWGCDGSSGQSVYKQAANEADFDDSETFVVSIVPLQIHCDTEPKVVIWHNETPSSPLYCRPLVLRFHKETLDLIRNETDNIKQQIQQLEATSVVVSGKSFTVHAQFHLTMVDGKVCNALTENPSSQTCYVCGAKPSEMNLQPSRSVKTGTYDFGLSTLHAWIRFMEWLLHVAYRLDFKTWQVKMEHRQAFQIRKKAIQKGIKERLGLNIDQPRQGGKGNSNDGNTARRFFDKPKVIADITGINEELINNCATLLGALSCGLTVDPERFNELAIKTRDLYVRNYNWFYMPVTAHKILVHGAEIIRHSVLPIGQMSEEAQEARHKHFSSYRERFACKTSRENTMRDVCHRLLETSDPYISWMRQKQMRKPVRKTLTSAILSLLQQPEVASSDSDPNESCSD